MAMDYNKTINLPQTDFPMRAGLPKREPEMLAQWKKIDVYKALLKRTKASRVFPCMTAPFSNGALHMGHALNKAHQGFHHPQLCHAGLLHALYPRLGQPRHAH